VLCVVCEAKGSNNQHLISVFITTWQSCPDFKTN